MCLSRRSPSRVLPARPTSRRSCRRLHARWVSSCQYSLYFTPHSDFPPPPLSRLTFKYLHLPAIGAHSFIHSFIHLTVNLLSDLVEGSSGIRVLVVFLVLSPLVLLLYQDSRSKEQTALKKGIPWVAWSDPFMVLPYWLCPLSGFLFAEEEAAAAKQPPSRHQTMPS